MKYLQICQSRWKRQSVKRKNAPKIWSYTDDLDTPEFYQLTFAERGLLLCLEKLQARVGGPLPDHCGYLARSLQGRGRDVAVCLGRLKALGLIEEISRNEFFYPSEAEAEAEAENPPNLPLNGQSGLSALACQQHENLQVLAIEAGMETTFLEMTNEGMPGVEIENIIVKARDKDMPDRYARACLRQWKDQVR